MNYEQVFFKTVTDPEFRRQLQENPRQALEGAGISPTDDQVTAMEKFDWNQLTDVQKAFGASAGDPAAFIAT